MQSLAAISKHHVLPLLQGKYKKHIGKSHYRALRQLLFSGKIDIIQSFHGQSYPETQFPPELLQTLCQPDKRSRSSILILIYKLIIRINFRSLKASAYDAKNGWQ